MSRMFGSSRLRAAVKADQHRIFADHLHLVPRNDKLLPFSKQAEKAEPSTHYHCDHLRLFAFDFHVADGPQAISVFDINDILIFKI